MPQRGLVFAWSERRTHDVVRGLIPVFVSIDLFTDDQVLNERFAKGALAFTARARDRVERITATGVHHVQRNTNDFSNSKRAVARFAFHFRGARKWMPFWTSNAARKYFVLEVGY